jgi:CheY-like chemotaxis protein
MKTILVVDDMAVFREPIAASLRLSGYKTLCAVDGEEALRITRANHPALILLDVAMPKMDGLTVLKHLRGDAAIANTPVILLTAVAETKIVLAAASLGVKDYLLKSRFRLNELLERIKRFDVLPNTAAHPATAALPQQPSPQSAATPSKLPAQTAMHGAARPAGTVSSAGKTTPADKQRADIPVVLTREQFLAKVQRIFQAKALSGVIAQVIALAGSPRGDTAELAELAELISRDPMLSVRVLQTANSATYASTGSLVTTIQAAITKIGFNAIRNIAATLGVFDCMPEASADGFNPIRCWQHSFAVAQLCERLVANYSVEEAGLAYLVGLCHDLGDIFVRTQFSREYQQVIEIAGKTGKNIEELHSLMLGVSPMQIASAVLKGMSIPPAIREPIEILHSQNKRRTDNRLAQALWMAENYANAAMLASSPISQIVPLTRAFCRAAVANPNPPLPDAQKLRDEVLCLTASLARLSHVDEAKLLAPMFNSASAKVWVARHAGISQFDPIAVAVESLAEHAIHEQLPTPKETQELHGLIIVAPTPGAAGILKNNFEAIQSNTVHLGHKLPTLAISAEAPRSESQADLLSCRSCVALDELAAFIATLSTNSAQKAA